MRVGFAAAVRAEFDRRKRLRQVLDYDDMILRLAQTLTDPSTERGSRRGAERQVRVVLVDEFQDTDPQQWAFLKAGFHRRSIMMLIGDPKQAIYRFRGGDIETYTAARESADQVLRSAPTTAPTSAWYAAWNRCSGPSTWAPRAHPSC